MKPQHIRYLSLAVVALGLVMPRGAAHATELTMSATYFTISESDPDFGTNPCCDYVSTNEVMPTLGPDGLPVYNPSYTTQGNVAGTPLNDVNSNGELTWWSPSENPNVQETGTGTVTLPYANGDFYPPNGIGSNDANGYQGAIFTGVLDVPTTESVEFTFGADDDAFLALDDTVIDQIGSIHGDTPAPVDTTVLSPGDYIITLFYVDRHQTGAALNFSIDTEGVSITPPPSPVPEPSSMALLGAGLAGLGAMRRRKKA